MNNKQPIKDAKVGVVGGRKFYDKDKLYAVLDAYNEKHGISFIISGGAYGADTLAEVYAKDREISYTVFVAEWTQYGKRAGYRRNLKIVETSDVIIAFPDPNSKGTWHTVNLAKKMNKPVYVIGETKDEHIA